MGVIMEPAIALKNLYVGKCRLPFTVTVCQDNVSITYLKSAIKFDNITNVASLALLIYF